MSPNTLAIVVSVTGIVALILGLLVHAVITGGSDGPTEPDWTGEDEL
jgi:hypothetical protein